MQVDVPAALRALGMASGDIYVAGGAVRDTLLGRPAADYDLAGPLLPNQLAQLQIPGLKVSDAMNGLGTALLHWEDGCHEYTAFRQDSYGRDGEHRPISVVFTADLLTDANRRDFTINALYVHLPDGEVLDPLGNGLADLESGIVRMTRPQTLDEDALRILRMVRFAAALGFVVEESTWDAARAHVSGLARISKERIQDELFRILLADTFYGHGDAVRRGLYMLRDVGALRVFLPDLLEGRGVHQSSSYHRYDVLDHQIETCAAAPPDLTTRLAALLHDVAKPEVQQRDGNMYAHPQAGEEKARRALQALGAPRRLTENVCSLVREHMFDLDNTAHEKAVLRRVNRLGREQFERLADLREADFAGSGMGAEAKSAQKWRRMLRKMDSERVPFSVRDLAVNGTDLMQALGLQPGPEIGRLLDALLEFVQLRPRQNNYKSLIKYAKIWLTGQQGAVRSSSDTE